MRAWQLLDCGQRHERILHFVSRGDVQREQRVDCVERVLGVPCGGVLLGWMLVVERERAVRAWQLLDCGQRRKRILHFVSRGDVQREQRVDCIERVLGVP